MQVSNTVNVVGISSNVKYLLLLLLLLQLMLKVPSISTHAGSQMSTPLIHFRVLHRWFCDPSRTTPLSVAQSSDWCHELLSGIDMLLQPAPDLIVDWIEL